LYYVIHLKNSSGGSAPLYQSISAWLDIIITNLEFPVLIIMQWYILQPIPSTVSFKKSEGEGESEIFGRHCQNFQREERRERKSL
jgi:hypothetical protein